MKAIQVTKGQIKRESDKALLVQVCTGRGEHRDVWFPKSQIILADGVMFLPDWLHAAKSKDIGGLITLDPSVLATISTAA